MFNQENELALILNRRVEMEKIPALMRSILAKMARRISRSGFDHFAYIPSNPCRQSRHQEGMNTPCVNRSLIFLEVGC